MRRDVLIVTLLTVAGIVVAADVPEDGNAVVPPEESTAAATDPVDVIPDGPKVISGMSVLGNQEAPKSLVIAPWKSSELGDSIGITTMLDDSKGPIDREVFMRELSYYEIRSGSTPAGGVQTPVSSDQGSN